MAQTSSKKRRRVSVSAPGGLWQRRRLKPLVVTMLVGTFLSACGAHGYQEADLQQVWFLRKGVEAELLAMAVQICGWAEELWTDHERAGVRYRD